MIRINLCLILILFFLCGSVSAKDRSVLVVDGSNKPIAFVGASFKQSSVVCMTDESGFLLFNDEKLSSNDTLVFCSIFYEHTEITLLELLAVEKIVLKSVVHKIDDVVVFPENYVQKLVKDLSDFFSEHYSRDYVSKMIYTKTIECNGKYREFVGFKGLLSSLNFNQKKVQLDFMDDNQLVLWIPLTVMRSNPFTANGNSVLEVNSVCPNPVDWTKKGLLIGYQDNNNRNILELKRSIEIFTPLNPKQVKNFNYRICGKSDSSDVVIIHFQTKESAFPVKTRIYGQGFIYYCTKTHLVEKIVMENHIDKLMFPRWKTIALVPCATQHYIEINYTLLANKIYTESASLSVKWIDPNTDERIYYIKHNSRRNPIKNKLVENEYVSFSEMVDLNKEKKEIVRKNVSADGHMIFCAPFIKSQWNKTSTAWLEWGRLEEELNINGENLYEQAEKNALKMNFDSPDSNELLIKSYFKRIKDLIYPLVYNTNSSLKISIPLMR